MGALGRMLMAVAGDAVEDCTSSLGTPWRAAAGRTILSFEDRADAGYGVTVFFPVGEKANVRSAPLVAESRMLPAFPQYPYSSWQSVIAEGTREMQLLKTLTTGDLRSG